MYKNFYFILILILTIISCKNKNGNSIENESDKISQFKTLNSEQKKIVKDDSTSISESFTNDSLVKNWIEKIQFQSGKNQELILSENKYDSTKVDTLIRITSDKNKIEFYISGNKKILKSATLKNQGASFNKIKIGMNLEDFEKVIKEDLSPNSELITLFNFEQTNQFEFRFKDQKLAEIDYYGYLD